MQAEAFASAIHAVKGVQMVNVDNLDPVRPVAESFPHEYTDLTAGTGSCRCIEPAHMIGAVASVGAAYIGTVVEGFEGAVDVGMAVQRALECENLLVYALGFEPSSLACSRVEGRY